MPTPSPLARSAAGLALSALLAVGASACKSEEKGTPVASKGTAPAGATPGGGKAGGAGAVTGKALATGLASDLRVAPDGTAAAYLLDAKKPRLEGTASQIQMGELRFARVDGSWERKAGERVVNAPGGYLFSPDSRWLIFMQSYNPANHDGELMVVDAASKDAAPRSLGKDVSYFVTSPDSKWVAFVESGALRVAELGTDAIAADVSPDVRTAEFSPDSKFLIAKQTLNAKAALLLTRVGDWSKQQKLGENVGDYAVASDSAHLAFAQRSDKVPGTFDLFHARLAEGKAKPLSSGVTTGAPFFGATFAFSPDGKWLARIEGAKPDKRGSLVVGPAAGGKGSSVAEEVYRFEFSPDSAAVAYLDRYADNKGTGNGHGNVGIALRPEWKGKKLGLRSPNFNWGADGRHLAFITRVFNPIYSVDLMLYSVGATDPAQDVARKVGVGVFGYEFSTDNKFLLMRTNCVRDGRACELHALDLSSREAKPEKILEGVYSFRTAPKGPQRVLATYARVDNVFFDAMAFNMANKQFKTLDRGIQLPAIFAAPDGSKVVYVVAEKGRAGVYVSEAMP